jgi:hypothetical protein
MRLPPYARNPIRLGDDGDVAYIALSRGQEAVIDAADLARVALYHWRACWDKSIERYYAAAQWKYLGCLPVRQSMHRFILDAAQGQMVRHIDRDALNNRRANLRLTMTGTRASDRREAASQARLETASPQVDPFDEGYIAGLVVGEGCWTGDKHAPALAVKMHADDPQPIQHLERILGGRIYGPYRHGGRHYHLYLLRGVALRRALPLFDRILPPSRKRDQYEAWKARFGYSTAAADYRAGRASRKTWNILRGGDA